MVRRGRKTKREIHIYISYIYIIYMYMIYDIYKCKPNARWKLIKKFSLFLFYPIRLIILFYFIFLQKHKSNSMGKGKPFQETAPEQLDVYKQKNEH